MWTYSMCLASLKGMRKRRVAFREGGKTSKQAIEPLRISMVSALQPRRYWANSEKSGSWPTIMTLLKSKNPRSSERAVSGFIPQASHD